MSDYIGELKQELFVKETEIKQIKQSKQKPKIKTQTCIKGSKYTVLATPDYIIDEAVVCDGLFLDENKDGKQIKISSKAVNRFKTILHEVSHAYFYESGLPFYYRDETLVSWLENNIEQIFNTSKQVFKDLFNNKELKDKGDNND